MKNKSAIFLILAILFLILVLVFAFFYFIKNPQLLGKLGIGKNSIIENAIIPKPTADSVSRVLESSQQGNTVTQKELNDIQKALESSNKTPASTQTQTAATNKPSTIQNALSEEKAARVRADINNILSGGN